MTKRAYDKIKAGLDDARAYLDGTADKRRFGVHLPARKTAARGGRSGTRAWRRK